MRFASSKFRLSSSTALEDKSGRTGRTHLSSLSVSQRLSPQSQQKSSDAWPTLTSRSPADEYSKEPFKVPYLGAKTPVPVPRKNIDWHILVVEANRNSASLLRHHVEVQARKTFAKSCVVECLEKLPEMRHEHKKKKHAGHKKGKERVTANPSNSSEDSSDSAPQFTFVLIDIGRIFPNGLSAQSIEKRKRKKGWWVPAFELQRQQCARRVNTLLRELLS